MLSESATPLLSSPVFQALAFLGIAVAAFYAVAARDGMKLLAGAMLVVAALLVLPMFTSERSSWEQFKIDHKCVVIEKRDSQTTSGVGFTFEGQVGVGFGSTPAQVAYRCDDGVTYWKDQ